MILSKLSSAELLREINIRLYPKWWTLCLLRSLGLQTLNACFIDPKYDSEHIKDLVGRFTKEIKRDDVLVRSDGGTEKKIYPRGGITYEYKSSLQAINDFIDLGRSVIVMEPTNRLSNILSLNISIKQDLSWEAEALGCGFDTSDLQRDLVIPEWSWSGDRCEPSGGGSVRARDVRGGPITNCTHDDRINQRLKSIAELFNLGDGVNCIEFARSLLLESNNTCLFSTHRIAPSRSYIARIVEDALLIANYLGDDYLPFTLAHAQLSDRRRIFWDVSFGKTKWGFGERCSNDFR